MQLFLVVLTGGILCLALIPYLIHKEIEETLTLAGPRAGLYQTWRNGTAKNVVIKNIYHLFHITNPYEVEHHGATPKVELKGPYVYEHVKWRPEEATKWFANGTMEYKSLQRNIFIPEESVVPNENETITTPRTGIFMAMQQGAAQGYESFILDAIKATNVTSMFQNRSVYHLIHGYEEPVLTWLADRVIFLGQHLSNIVAFDPDQTDASAVAPDQIYSGAAPSSTQPRVPSQSLGDYTMVSGMTRLNFWGSDEANTLRGSDATVYPPLIMLNANRPLYAYVTDISRSITLLCTDRRTEYGIPVHRYRLDAKLFYNSNLYPPNAAYYITHSGLQPTTPCQNSTDGKGLDKKWIFAAISKALFLDADMHGLNVHLPRPANVEEDDITLDYEPITSTLIEAHKRLQLNLRLRPVDGVVASAHLPYSWLPVFKYDETAVLPQKDLDTLKDDVLGPLLAVLVVGIIATVVGFIGFVVTCWQFCKAPPRDDSDASDRERLGLLNHSHIGRQDSSATYKSAHGRELQYSAKNLHETDN